MRGCRLTPPAPGDLECLLNQWEAWAGMVKRGLAGVYGDCLDCPEGALVLQEASDIRSGPREARQAARPWGKYANEGWRPQAGTPAPPGTPALPDWLGDATPAVRRAYLRETVKGA